MKTSLKPLDSLRDPPDGRLVWESSLRTGLRGGGFVAIRSRQLVVLIALTFASWASAGSVRVWSDAVVVESEILLRDIASLELLDPSEHAAVSTIAVGPAPNPGGSRFVRMDEIRTALTSAGINMARLTLSGATQCGVVRPVDSPISTAEVLQSPRSGAPPGQVEIMRSGGGLPTEVSTRSMRSSIVEFFAQETSRHGGEPDIVFDRASDAILALQGGVYEFRVHRRSGPELGVVSLGIEVFSSGKLVQEVSLLVRLSMKRPTLVARRAINQSAVVASGDVELTTLNYTRIESLGFNDPAAAIGQRAKRFVAQGAVIEADALEPLPLVQRGEIVTLESLIGGIRVVMSGKAMQSGRLGERIVVRRSDRKDSDVEATVIGLGSLRAELGAAPGIGAVPSIGAVPGIGAALAGAVNP